MKLPVALAILFLTGVGVYVLLKDHGRDMYHTELAGTLECMGTTGVTAGEECVPGIRTSNADLYAVYIAEIKEETLALCRGLPVLASGTSTTIARFKDPGHFFFVERDWEALGATRLLYAETLFLCAT